MKLVKFFAATALLTLALASCESEPEHKYNADISKDSSAIFKNEEELYSYVKKFGAKETMTRLHDLSSQFGSCHDTAHRAGRFAYELYDEQSFKECSAECHSGCYHGATEAFFKENGTDELTEKLKVICSSELNNFFSHQCLHGIGHGLMAWTDYDLPEALKSCELLPRGKESCFTGVFMENIVGTLGKEEGHTSKYLSEDPQFPCTTVGEKYKSSCYFLQTSRMLQLFGTDFKKVAAACSKAPEAYQRTCFESMGRDIGGSYRYELEPQLKACGYAPKGTMRTSCLTGAVQDRFWDPSGQDISIKFCTMLKDKEEKAACYGTIIPRSKEILQTEADQKKFCEKVEEAYRKDC